MRLTWLVLQMSGIMALTTAGTTTKMRIIITVTTDCLEYAFHYPILLFGVAFPVTALPLVLTRPAAAKRRWRTHLFAIGGVSPAIDAAISACPAGSGGRGGTEADRYRGD